MCMSKVQHTMGRKTRFFWSFNFSTNLTTGNLKISEFVQLQPVVWSFSVGFSSVSVIFLAQQTEPVNASSWHIINYAPWYGDDSWVHLACTSANKEGTKHKLVSEAVASTAGTSPLFCNGNSVCGVLLVHFLVLFT